MADYIDASFDLWELPISSILQAELIFINGISFHLDKNEHNSMDILKVISELVTEIENFTKEFTFENSENIIEYSDDFTYNMPMVLFSIKDTVTHPLLMAGIEGFAGDGEIIRTIDGILIILHNLHINKPNAAVKLSARLLINEENNVEIAGHLEAKDFPWQKLDDLIAKLNPEFEASSRMLTIDSLRIQKLVAWQKYCK